MDAELTDKVYKLFAGGNPPHSDKVKALLPKAGTRNIYYHNWKRDGKPNGYEPKGEKTTVGRGAGEVALPGATVGGIDTTKQPTLQASIPKLEEKPVMEKTDEAEEPPQEEPPAEEPPKGEPPEEKAKGGIILAFGADEKEIDLDHMEGYALAVKTTLSLKTLMLYQIEAGRRGDNLEVGDFIDECVADYFRGRGVDLGLVDLGGSKDAK